MQANKIIIIFVQVFFTWNAIAQPGIEEIRDCEQRVLDNRYQAYDSILYFADKQLVLANELGDSIEIGKAHLSLAYAHYNLDNDGDDLVALIEARQIFRTIKNDSLNALATLELASMYKEAISEYFMPDSLLHGVIKYAIQNNADEFLARSYMELGLIFRNRYRSNISRDSIMYYYTKAKNEADKSGNRRLSDAVLNNIADYYLIGPHKNLDTVIYLSNQVLHSPQHDDRTWAVASLNSYIAYLEQGDPKAVRYLIKGYNTAKKVRPLRLVSAAAKLLYNHYYRSGVYDSALFYYQKAEVGGANKRTRYVLLTLETKANASDQAREQNLLLERNLSIQENLNSALIFGSLVLVIFIVMIIRTNSVIKDKNQALRKEKEHNARLLKEIHHRVKNNLQMIVGLLDLQESSIKNKAVSVVLNDAGSRVKSIALIHQNLYKGDTDMVSVGFNKYIEELCDNLIYSYDMGDKLDVILDIDEIELPFNRAVILGLLITELITNVLKHAFIDKPNGVLRVEVKRIDNSVKLIVADNGSGLSENAENKEGSFGFDLIHSFVSDLKGKIEFSNGEGTTVKVVFDEEELRNG